MRPLRALLAVLLIVVAAGTLGSPAAGQEPALTLQPGWNLIGWTGEAAPAQAVGFELGSGIERILRYDPSAARFRAFSSTGPAFLNDLDDVAHAVGLWAFANAGSSFTPPTAAAPLSFDLDPGFNLVAWTAAGSTITAALAPLGDALLAAFTWDPIGERFLSYRPGVPAVLNTATDLRRGDGLWLDLSRTVQWPPSSSTVAAGCDAASEPQPTIISGPDGPNGPDNDSVFRALAVHPTDADTRLVGTERNGFLRSTDGGSTWTRQRAGLHHFIDNYAEIWDIAYAPSDPSLVYAAALDSPGPPKDAPSAVGGVYRSRDGGLTWLRMFCGLATGRVTSVAVDPNDANVVIAGTEGGATSFSSGDTPAGIYYEGGVYRSTDAGESWQRVVLADGDGRNGYWLIRTVPGPPTTFLTYALDIKEPANSLGFYISEDAGASWEPLGDPLSGRAIAAFAVSADGGTIVANERDAFRHELSSDLGLGWTSSAGNQGSGPVSISPLDADLVLYGGTGPSLYRSSDGLASNNVVLTAEQPPGHPRVPPVQVLEFAPSDPQIVYAVTEGYLVYRSEDAGLTWELRANLRRDVLNAVP